jgi:hypothetical protein
MLFSSPAHPGGPSSVNVKPRRLAVVAVALAAAAGLGWGAVGLARTPEPVMVPPIIIDVAAPDSGQGTDGQGGTSPKPGGGIGDDTGGDTNGAQPVPPPPPPPAGGGDNDDDGDDGDGDDAGDA